MFADKPFIKIIIPFLVGIILSIYLPDLLSESFSYAVLLILITYLLTDRYYFKIQKKFKYRYIYALIIHICIFTCGYHLTQFHTSIQNKNKEVFESKDGMAIATIIEEPVKKQKSIKTVIRLNGYYKNNQWVICNSKAILYLQIDSLSNSLKHGDKIIFSPEFKRIDSPKNPAEFNYKQYLSFHHIYYQSYLKSGEWFKSEISENSLRRMANEIRQTLLAILKKNITDENAYPVASALILGYKDELDTETQKAYAGSGAMHVLAVSGLHAGFVFMILNSFLFFLNNKKTILLKMFIIIAGLWTYAILTGLSPSVLRAATMFSFIVIAKTINRHTNIYNTLAASAFILLCFNPYLVMEVGFQLSYLAVIGIVYFQPKLYTLIYIKNYFLDKIWAITCVSIAAQLTTFPLGLLYFHQFPNYFLFSNLIVIPMAIIILSLGILFFIFSFIPFLSAIIGTILSWLIQGLNYSVSYIEKLPFSITEGIDISIFECWVIFVILFLIALYIEFKKNIYVISMLCCILCLCIYNVYETIAQNTQKSIIVYHVNNHSALNFIDGRENILLADSILVNDEDKMRFHIYHYWYRTGVKHPKIINTNYLDNKLQQTDLISIKHKNLFIKENYLQFYNTILAIVSDEEQLFDYTTYKLELDYVLLRDNTNCSIEQLAKNYKFKKLIIDASNSDYKIDKWTKEATKMNISVFNVKNEGAWIYNLE